MQKLLLPKALIALAAFFTAASSSAADIRITEDGKPVAAIVLGGSGASQDVAVAALVSHVKQMSGATLPVFRGKELGGFRVEAGRLVAPSAKTAAQSFILLGDGELAHRLGVSLDGVGPDGIVLKTTGNVIALLGRRRTTTAKRDEPTANATFRFLETLGCRNLWPGESGKVVPKMSTITVADLDVRFTPPIGQRNIRFGAADFRGAEQGLAWLGATVAEYRAAKDAASHTESEGDWSAWNGLGGNIGIVGGAAGGGLRGGWEEHGKAHPEWFALQVDGTRDQSRAKERWRLCVSNEGLIEHVANDIIAQLGGQAQNAISLCPNDGGYASFCMCEACKKLDAPSAPKVKMLMFAKVGESARTELDYVSLTDRYVHYWNAIAERVTKVVPDQLFLIEAYSYYSDPPLREKLHPNLVLRYVPNTADGWKGWQAAGATRVYWRPNNLHSGYRDGVLSPRARENSSTLRYLAEHGMLATDMDSIHDHWATQGLHYYAMARLSWNPSQEFDAVLEDYCKSGFGAGAQPVKQYFLLTENGVQLRHEARRDVFPLIAPETISAMRAELIAAAKSTENDPPSHRRVAFLRAGLEFTAISAEAHRLADAAANGAHPEAKKVNEVMERRWQMMRAILRQHPLAVNVGVVAAGDVTLSSALGWKGPSEAVKAGKFQLHAGDDWLNEDQSATRKR